jgi:hypothetical protein
MANAAGVEMMDGRINTGCTVFHASKMRNRRRNDNGPAARWFNPAAVGGGASAMGLFQQDFSVK